MRWLLRFDHRSHIGRIEAALAGLGSRLELIPGAESSDLCAWTARGRRARPEGEIFAGPV